MKLFRVQTMSFLSRSAILAAFALLGGCATLSDSPQQQLELHAVLDYREIGGVGCILSNDVGRWYVVAPGRVTVTRSARPLKVSCKKAGTGAAAESFASRADVSGLMGNLVISAGLGYAVDRYSGAGHSYPANLTVLMEPTAQPELAAGEQAVDARVF